MNGCFQFKGSADDLEIYGASISDDDEDADPLPWESIEKGKPLRPDDHVLPDHSSQSKLSPLLPNFGRGGHSKGGQAKARDTKPKVEIQVVKLSQLSGLEGAQSLSTQDSLEISAANKGSSVTSTIKTTPTSIAPAASNISSPNAASSASLTASSLSSSLSVTSNATTITKRSIQAEKSAPLTATSYSNLNSNTIAPSSQMASSTSSSTLFMKVGKSTKKHSLDEDFIAGTTGKQLLET